MSSDTVSFQGLGARRIRDGADTPPVNVSYTDIVSLRTILGVGVTFRMGSFDVREVAYLSREDVLEIARHMHAGGPAKGITGGA